MNEVIKAMLTRRSTKNFKPDMIPESDIDTIIQAGLYAANGRGRQASIVVAISDKKVRDRLSEVNCKIGGWPAGFDPFYGAPVVLVVLDEKSDSTKVYDGSLVMGNMMLAASSLGIGSCWIHRAKETFELPEFKEFLKSIGVREEYEGVGHCVLGYPTSDEKKTPVERKSGRVFYVR